jgi:biotin carboxylase
VTDDLQGKRILLVAATTGYQTRVFAEAAQRLGMHVVLGTDRCRHMEDPWGDGALPVRFDRPEESLALIEEEAAERSFDGIVAVGDRPVFLAALAAERLGIPYNPPAAVAASRDKFLMRQCFQVAGLRLPSFFRLGIDDGVARGAERAPYPCVLKPLGLSGSRGVIRANSPAEFETAFVRIKAILETREIRRLREPMHRFVQVESYIPGREYALEGIVTDGRLQVLALFDKPDPLEGPFFEETIYVSPSREPAERQVELARVAQEAVRALGLQRGPVHIEMRANETGVWVLEAAARPIGGLCAKALRFDGGMSLEELILRHAVGMDVSRLRLSDRASGVMMIPIPTEGIYEDVSGVEAAMRVPGIEEVIITAKQGQQLVPLPEGSSYLGFLFARAASPAAVESALRGAHRRLQFRITAALPVVTS